MGDIMGELKCRRQPWYPVSACFGCSVVMIPSPLPILVGRDCETTFFLLAGRWNDQQRRAQPPSQGPTSLPADGSPRCHYGIKGFQHLGTGLL